MNRARSSYCRACLLLVSLALLATPAAATNGMYLAGYGAETGGRGGANLAISDRTLALNFNPAGIGQLQGNHLSLNLSVLAPSLYSENMINPITEGEDRLFALPALAYVRGAKDSPWTWGVGFIAQGGMGATFEFDTFFGTRDETFSEVRFGTVSPTVSYSLSEDMALGLTLNLGYGDASFRFFPETSFLNPVDPAMSFFGVNLKQAGGLQTNARLGWWWRMSQKVAVGAVYQTETDSSFENGDMWVNFTAHPALQDKVRYSADIDGFTFASQAGVGLSIRPTRDWQVAFDVKRYFWDQAMDTITVTATGPQTPGAPPEVVLPFVFNWQDQWVLAAGADYRVNDWLTLRGGFNFGENPVPSDTLTPLFPATVERHVTLGASWLVKGRTFELAVERAFNSDQTNYSQNPSLNPFGPGSRVEHSQWTASFGVSWAWARNGAARAPGKGIQGGGR